MRKSEVAEEKSEGDAATKEVIVEMGLHQGPALGCFLFAMIMTSEVRHESVWTRMFTSRSLVGAGSRFKRAWRSKGRKVNRTKTRYMYVNEREIVGKLSMQRGNVDAFLNVYCQPSKTTNIAQERRRKCRQSGTDGDQYRVDL